MAGTPASSARVSSPRLRWLAQALAALSSTCSFCACSGASGPPPAPPAVEGPEEAIARIGTIWEARHTDKGLRSSPSPIASFDRQLLSRIELTRGSSSAVERISFEERFILRDAREVRCQGQLEAPLHATYGTRSGEPALELDWPEASQPRSCDSPDAPIPPFERPAGRARFVLRSDQLVGVEPALEKRVFLPVE